MPPIFRVFLALLLAIASPLARAWGEQGHQIIGELAERQLSPAAHAQVHELLAGEADPSLAGVSTWAEYLREHDPELGKRSYRWHFINFPRGQTCAYVPARDCPDGNCVVAAIDAQRAILADRGAPVVARRQALKFLVHFVGDVHQPLHAGHGDDLGGNRFQVSYQGEGSNLHAIWDHRILQTANLATDAYADRLQALPLPAPEAAAHAGNPAAGWALESCSLVQQEGFYPESHRIEPGYIERFRPLAEQRLAIAGRRLAAMIEAALDGRQQQSATTVPDSAE